MISCQSWKSTINKYPQAKEYLFVILIMEAIRNIIEMDMESWYIRIIHIIKDFGQIMRKIKKEYSSIRKISIIVESGKTMFLMDRVSIPAILCLTTITKGHGLKATSMVLAMKKIMRGLFI